MGSKSRKAQTYNGKPKAQRETCLRCLKRGPVARMVRVRVNQRTGYVHRDCMTAEVRRI